MTINYRGERFSGYNKPKRTPNKSKKFAVLAKQGKQVKLIRYGDPNLSIKKAQPKSKKLYTITKPNGKTIERYDLGSYVKTYEAKGCKVEEV